MTRNTGRSLEALVLASRQGATIRKCPSGVRWVGPGKHIPIPSPCDFFGVIHDTGQAIVFDAKECGSAQFKTSTSTLPEHQRLELLEFAEAGAISGLLALSTRDNFVYWLDAERLTRREPSYSWDSLRRLGPAHLSIPWRRLQGWYECPVNPALGIGLSREAAASCRLDGETQSMEAK